MKFIDTDIYAITGEEFSKGKDNISVVKELLEAGVRIIQYREKNKTREEKLKQCLEIVELTKKAGAIFIVNDDLDLAIECNAHGVHLGQGDMDVLEARKKAPNMIIGVSTHKIEDAKAAVSKGADYIGVGPTYFTSTKKNLSPGGGLDYLKWVSENINIPYVAIGGIKESNINEVQAFGGKTFAMISELVGEENIKEKVIKIRNLLK